MDSTALSESQDLHFTIQRTWNDQLPSSKPEIHLTFSKTGKDEEKGLAISIEAPLYNDPRVPDSIPPGSTDKLWDYEVVEVFLLGDEDKYLEIELAPSGHYLLLQLHGQRNIIQQHLPLNSFQVDQQQKKQDGRWSARVIIPVNYLPVNIKRFNAYAIHGQDPNRRYMSLFPTPNNKYEQPDFHRLDYFQPIQLSSLIN